MLDTNIFDTLDEDPEVVSELMNRRDLRLFVSTVQLDELRAIPDRQKRERLMGLAANLCVSVSSDMVVESSSAKMQATTGPASNAAGRHAPDHAIMVAARHRCDILLSEDRKLLEHAVTGKIRVMDWHTFVSRVVFNPR